MDEVQGILDINREKLRTPDDFKFPYSPYPIQKDFMQNLYKAIEDRKLAIFESPTGTGKTLSIICAALTWLKDHKQREINGVKKAISSIEVKSEIKSNDWLSDQILEMKNNSMKLKLKKCLDKIVKSEEKFENIKERIKEEKKKRICSKAEKNISSGVIDSKQLEEDDRLKLMNDEIDNILLEEFADEGNDEECSDEDDETEKIFRDTKIIFCSRTHSQLSQFISELKKTSYANDVRLTPLASRQSYCINKNVNKLNSLSLMNEK